MLSLAELLGCQYGFKGEVNIFAAVNNGFGMQAVIAVSTIIFSIHFAKIMKQLLAAAHG